MANAVPNDQHDAAGSVGDEELAVGHAQRARQRSGEDAQQGNEPAEEDCPDAPLGEHTLGPSEVRRPEVLGEAPPEPFEQGTSAAPADRVSDGVADDRADRGADGDPPDADDLRSRPAERR